MPVDTKELAEAVIKHLLLGAEVRGLRFGPQPDILFAGSAADKPTYLQPYLKLASRWTVFSSLPQNLPDDESQLPEMSPEEELELIWHLRGDLSQQCSLASRGVISYSRLGQGGRSSSMDTTSGSSVGRWAYRGSGPR